MNSVLDGGQVMANFRTKKSFAPGSKIKNESLTDLLLCELLGAQNILEESPRTDVIKKRLDVKSRLGPRPSSSTSQNLEAGDNEVMIYFPATHVLTVFEKAAFRLRLRLKYKSTIKVGSVVNVIPTDRDLKILSGPVRVVRHKNFKILEVDVERLPSKTKSIKIVNGESFGLAEPTKDRMKSQTEISRHYYAFVEVNQQGQKQALAVELKMTFAQRITRLYYLFTEDDKSKSSSPGLDRRSCDDVLGDIFSSFQGKKSNLTLAFKSIAACELFLKNIFPAKMKFNLKAGLIDFVILNRRDLYIQHCAKDFQNGDEDRAMDVFNNFKHYDCYHFARSRSSRLMFVDCVSVRLEMALLSSNKDLQDGSKIIFDHISVSADSSNPKLRLHRQKVFLCERATLESLVSTLAAIKRVHPSSRIRLVIAHNLRLCQALVLKLKHYLLYRRFAQVVVGFNTIQVEDVSEVKYGDEAVKRFPEDFRRSRQPCYRLNPTNPTKDRAGLFDNVGPGLHKLWRIKSWANPGDEPEAVSVEMPGASKKPDEINTDDSDETDDQNESEVEESDNSTEESDSDDSQDKDKPKTENAEDAKSEASDTLSIYTDPDLLHEFVDKSLEEPISNQQQEQHQRIQTVEDSKEYDVILSNHQVAQECRLLEHRRTGPWIGEIQTTANFQNNEQVYVWMDQPAREIMCNTLNPWFDVYCGKYIMFVGNKSANGHNFTGDRGLLKLGTCTKSTGEAVKAKRPSSCSRSHAFEVSKEYTCMPSWNTRIKARCSDVSGSARCLREGHPIVMKSMFDQISVASTLLVINYLLCYQVCNLIFI